MYIEELGMEIKFEFALIWLEPIATDIEDCLYLIKWQALSLEIFD